MRDKIFIALEGLGINFSEAEKASGQDVDLREYLYDSIELIMFAITLEESVGFELTEEIFIEDNLKSLNTLASILKQSVRE